jgi:hypothetical protein
LFKQIKKNYMKKFLSVLAIAALVSCNNETKTEEAKPVADTTAAPAPAPVATDVTPAVVDTLVKKVDTAAAAK